MVSFEERVAFLEGRVSEHSRAVDGIREAIRHMEERMDRRFEAVDRRLTSVDDKMTRHFVWLVGIQVTTLAAIIAALAAR